MNNLKRVLSLALSGVMLVGMMAVGASAAEFTDADKIEHDDAVNILVALNVVNGKDDGSHFDPEGDVTRAEMAKMIAVAMNGGRDTNTGVKGTASFTDIKGHWAESYIEYCYDMGIISGRGDGTFAPGDNVTGLEATKMVLTALGYDSVAYKLTGASWAVRTDELAKAADPNLYDELGSVVMANKASRDTAAQLIWNGLQNRTKRVTPQQNTSTGEVTFVYGDGKGSLLQERYDANVWVGSFEGNKNTGATGAEKGEITVKGCLENATADKDGNLPSTAAHFPSDFDITFIGEEVKVIFKDGNGGTKNQPDKKDTIYGVFVTGTTNVLNVTSNDVEATDAADDGKVEVNGTEYDVVTPAAGDVLVEKNFGAETAVKATAADSDEVDAAFEALAEKNGDKIKFILDDSNKLKKAYVVHSELGKVTSKNSTKVNISGLGTIELDKNDVYDGIAKDDIVVFTKLYKSAAADAYTTVEKAEKVSGEVTGYKNSKDKDTNADVFETVTLDGTTYKIVDQAAMDENFTDDAITNFGTGHIGEEFDLYLVNGYVAAAVQTSESASNYSLVVDIKQSATAGSIFDGLQVQLMAADGTKSVHTVSKSSEDSDGNGSIETDDYPKGTIVTYTTDGDGNAKLKAVGKLKDASSNKGYTKKTKSFDGAPTTSTCVLFASTAATGGDYKAYNIRDLGDVTVADGTKNFAVVKDGDNVVAVFVDLKDTPDGATSNTVYGIVSAVNGTIKSGDTEYNTYTVSVAGEDYTVNIEANGGTKDSLTKGSIYKFDPTTDNNYVDSDKFTPVASVDGYQLGWTKAYNATDKLLTIWSAIEGVDKEGNVTTTEADIVRYQGKTAEDTMVLDDDADIYYVDTKADVSFEDGSVPSAFDPMTGYENVIVIGKDDDAGVFVISTLIVEVSGEKAIDE